jgi:23S rRNA (adenine2030-N6)-methyltransferase
VNYRHQFHAGNFADVMKHALLTRLLRGLQKKEKGFLCLDTHAGRGSYDLAAAAVGDTLARRPEWPDGIGRLWSRSDLPPALADYVSEVREFDRQRGNLAVMPRFYPGSPWIARNRLRPVDRLALCERHQAECDALRAEMAFAPRASVHQTDGYGAIRGMLPPPERRGLTLIDPPFEEQDEFTRIAGALEEGLKRFPTGVYAIWYPLTERARVDEFFTAIRHLPLPPTLAVEVIIAGEAASIKLKGCGLLILNPPWQFEDEAHSIVAFLADALAQAPGGGGYVNWLVPE